MDQPVAESAHDRELLNLTTEIVSAYLGNTVLSMQQIPDVISLVYRTLSSLEKTAATPPAEQPKPAVPVKKSVTPEYLVCLEDGKHLRMLKRHLRTNYNMTPDEYREKWGLPADYPMVAPAYSKRRSEFAKESGLGRARTAGKR